MSSSPLRPAPVLDPGLPSKGEPVARSPLIAAAAPVARREHCEVRFEPTGRRARVPVGTSLLEAARVAGQPIARGCGAEGRCSRCGVSVIEGRIAEETVREAKVKERNRIDSKLRLACRIEVEDDLVVTAPYW